MLATNMPQVVMILHQQQKKKASSRSVGDAGRHCLISRKRICRGGGLGEPVANATISPSFNPVCTRATHMLKQR
ncbi:hypothetical protein BC835DRAFT_1364657 [Cytidiella melzeri]|nr:hypothetical protein BC835DRAFT_1364657 [Cytidiella melzeri]